ncbi:Scr1 family TA system antitoxin-like transcriptional regulator [Micromonospora sp. NBC_01699]|uniref:Scr1 family TA system antitoxin-like transcriptional regulator n=1 Tax=Micromonospora sp. NBC_01699 TaxID=2975984 RepID=UPI003FA5A643
MLADEEVEGGVVLRLDRQSVLDREQPPLLTVVIDEGAPRRPVGEPRVGVHLVSLSVRAYLGMRPMRARYGVE